MAGVRFYQSIQFKLIIIYVLLILIAMQLISVYFVRTTENSLMTNFTVSLNNQANLIAEYVKPYLLNADESNPEASGNLYDNLNAIVNNFNQFSDAEIQIISSSGVVLSSSLNQVIVGSKSTQPEVNRTLNGFRGQAEDVVDELGVRKRALVTPITDDNAIIGAVYIVASLEDLYETMDNINRIFIAGTMIALALTALLGIILANTITGPIKEITRTATALAEGNFHRKVRVSGNDEIGQLGAAFTNMRDRLREALSANEEERDKLSSILANMSDGVLATDDAGRVIVVNRRARQMLHRETDEIMNREISEILGIDRAKIDEYLSGADSTAMLKFDFTDDEPLLVKVTFTPIQRRGRGITGSIIVLQDVTEQEKLEQSRRDFVANVSHELRTPLTTIKSYLEALEDGALQDPQLAARFIGVARNETERMIRLVNDLLHLSRLDSRQAILHKEPTDLAEMLDDVADRFSFQLHQKSIEIVVSCDPDLPLVWLDPDQIDQVLDNLVSNAIKYTMEGGRIDIRAARTDAGHVTVTVQDTGIGIPKKDLSRIFERFYRVDKARSRSMGGTGLGLSIAREIVRAHDGTITIDSEVDVGTKISFTLPIGEGGKGS
jgi:two-component system sensor histidine kinase VicK